MGEVFRARDQRLDRVVALKTSRTQFSDRMMNEARAAAALNHPHIATLHDVGPDYLVMEFVEGETLHGPLPVTKALVYARQILDALAAAHRKGITHCDLKPANIMVSKSGVKLLDFGLAQIKQAVKHNGETQTIEMSGQGTISGTLQYMAPEQFEGKPLDARTDIFAFGLVLYEMLTGRPAFEGSSPATLMHAIINQEPPPLPETIEAMPAKLEWILRCCLAKDPDDRWQSARDVIHALDLAEAELQPAATPPTPAAPSDRPARVWPVAIGALVLGGLLVFGGMRLRGPKPPAVWTYRPLTYSGRAFRPVLSPDGKQVAYLWLGDRHNEGGLFVQLVSGGNPLRLPVKSVRGRPSWSPDGSELAFVNDSGLYAMPALGGATRKIVSFGNGGGADSVAWAPSRAFFILGGPGDALTVVPAEGGEPKKITKLPFGYDREPAISPDSSAVAFIRRTSTFNANILVLRLKPDGTPVGEPKAITTGVWDLGTIDWTPDGREIIFEGSAGSNNPSLWRIPREGGQTVRLIMPGMISGDPTLARQSGRLVYVSGQFETNISKVALVGHGAAAKPEPIVEAIGDNRDLSVSPDGAHIAFASNRTGSKEIWSADADGSKQTQLTSFLGPSVGSPRWSPDGKSIAFDGTASGSSDIYVVPVEGGKPVRLTTDTGNEIRPAWSHDGKWIYYGFSSAGHDQEIWKIPSSGGQPVLVSKSGYSAKEAPDGKWLYVLTTSGIVRMRPDGTGEEKVVNGGLDANLWNVSSRNLLLLNPKDHNILRIPFEGGKPEPIYQFDPSVVVTGGGTAFAVPNDESYAIYRSVTRSINTLMLIDGFR
jgi:serine/threonine protein kinase